MVKTHTSSKKTQKVIRLNVGILALCVLAIVTSFTAGIKSAPDIHPVDTIHADDAILGGDMNNDGILTSADAAIALEIALDYRTATTNELLADPNGDFTITVQDALTILHGLQ